MNKNVLIFSEDISGEKIAYEADKYGYVPYIVHSKKLDYMCKWNNFIINPYMDTVDLDKEIQKHMQEHPCAIICCIEQLMVNVAKYAQYIGVSTNPLSAYETLRDKRKMKKVWLEKKISTAKAILATTYKEACENMNLSYPVIVKPVYGAASAGVKIVYSDIELKNQIREILRFNVTTLYSEHASKTGFLIEEFIEGEEYSIDSIWSEKKLVTYGIMSKGKPEAPYFPDRLYLTDTQLDEKVKNELLKINNAVAEASGVMSGATHIEVKIKNGRGYVIEAALRPGAGGFFYNIFEKSSNINFFEALFLSSLPIKSAVEKERLNEFFKVNWNPKKRLYWYNMRYLGHGKIKSITGVDEIQNSKFVSKVILRKKVGEYLAEEGKSLSYLGWILGIFDDEISIDQCLEKLKTLEKKINITYE